MSIIRRALLVVVLGFSIALPADRAISQSPFSIFGGLKRVTSASTDAIEAVLGLILRHYYDPKRIDSFDFLEAGMQVIAQKVPLFLVSFSEDRGEMRIQLDTAVHNYTVSTLKGPMDILPFFAEVFERLQQSGLLKKENIELDDLEYAVGDAMLSTLDPHSNVMSPEMFEEFKTHTEGEFGGIGIVIGLRDGLLSVISPIEDTPAWRAKILAGDQIVRIDGEPTLNMPVNEAVDHLRGEVNTKVKLDIRRKGVEDFAVELTREIIQIESVQSALYDAPYANIAYLRIKSFQEDTYNELRKHLAALHEKSPGGKFSSLVLDLRNNPGGLLEQAVQVADVFLESGPIVMTVGPGGVVERIRRATEPDTEPNYPIIVLINDGSASAAEIVSSALRDNARALLVGEETFGKGSVQTVFGLGNEAAVKMTVSEYWTAGKRSIQTVGVTPDIRLFPMKVSDDYMDLLPNEQMGESELDKHLVSDQAKQQESRFELRYFDKKFFTEAKAGKYKNKKKPDAAEISEETQREYSRKASISDDYWATFARDLLHFQQKAGKPVSEAMLEGWLDRVSQTEEGRLAEAMASLAIDWRRGAGELPATAGGQIVLTTTFKENGQPVDPLRAGKEVVVEVTAENKGTAPIDRLLAVTESRYRHFIFDDLEFSFGHLEPGAKKTARAVLALSEALPTFVEPLTYTLYAAGSKEIGKQAVKFSVSSQEAPRFSMRYLFKESLPSEGTASLGNAALLAGNGSIDKGELVTLPIRVRNDGRAAASSVQVNLKNKSGSEVVLEKGREDLGALAIGEEKEAILSFRVKPEFSRDLVEIAFSVSDSETEARLDTDLHFPIGKTQNVTPRLATWLRPPTLKLTRVVSLPEKSKGRRHFFKVEGVVTDDTGLKDMQIFVGKAKVFLEANLNGKPEYPFSVELYDDPEEKERFFFMMSRDVDGLVDRLAYGIP